MNNPPVIFKVVPLGKPRMTQRDRWKKRPAVLRYHAFKDTLRARLVDLPHLRKLIDSGTIHGLSWTAYFPMPPSWSKRKQASLAGALHQQKPDRDNIDKAILDALFTDDSGIASGRIEKRWDDGKGPRIEITFEFDPHPATAPGNQPVLF
ncbi:RusA family crossover junction endodeoxyribonuclease [Luteolibacter pohnpeiensis]|uniref:RusA family crossover junction endodeoxyribonuclease n=1 Tax=Luteolibacter pohnpeiensis TaxID=454153 RepID=A0A934SAC9_9BACT|nr:RusA family crossover junction endodeoxyribonuclease [Luteolibacter pohnpeiensis]MBK1884758.1 RusA family crossover junction endodeoxyribonuclease [Luteolibacter pohnpeiensis]